MFSLAVPYQLGLSIVQRKKMFFKGVEFLNLFNKKPAENKETDLIKKAFGGRRFIVTQYEQVKRTGSGIIKSIVEPCGRETIIYTDTKTNKAAVSEYEPDGRLVKETHGHFEKAPQYDDFDEYIAALEAEQKVRENS